MGGAGWLGRAAREGGAEAGGGAAGGYLLALGQLSHRDFLHVALRVEVRELQVGGQLRAAPDWGRQYRDRRCAAAARAPKAPEPRCNTALSPCHPRRWPAWPGSGATACELEPAREQGTAVASPLAGSLGGERRGSSSARRALRGAARRCSGDDDTLAADNKLVAPILWAAVMDAMLNAAECSECCCLRAC